MSSFKNYNAFTSSLLIILLSLSALPLYAVNDDVVSENSEKTQASQKRPYSGSNNPALLPGKIAKNEPPTFAEKRVVNDLIFEPKKLGNEILGFRVLHQPKAIHSPLRPSVVGMINWPEALLATINSLPWWLKWVHPLSYLNECSKKYCILSRLKYPEARKRVERLAAASAIESFSRQNTLKIVMLSGQGLFQELILAQKLVKQGVWDTIELHVINPQAKYLTEIDEEQQAHNTLNVANRAAHQFLNWFTHQNCDVQLHIYNNAYDFLRLEFAGRSLPGHTEINMLLAVDWRHGFELEDDVVFSHRLLLLALPPNSFSFTLSELHRRSFSIVRRNSIASPFQSMDDGWLAEYSHGSSRGSYFLTGSAEYDERHSQIMHNLFEQVMMLPEDYLHFSEILGFQNRHVDIDEDPQQTANTVTSILNEIARHGGTIDPVWISGFSAAVIGELLSMGIFKQQQLQH